MPILDMTAAVTVAVVGSGQFLIDDLLGFDSLVPKVAVGIILASSVMAALAALVLRRSPDLAHKSS